MGVIRAQQGVPLRRHAYDAWRDVLQEDLPCRKEREDNRGVVSCKTAGVAVPAMICIS